MFALRADAMSKPGGDSTKVTRYAAGLAARGWKCEVVTSPADLSARKSDVVHLVNLDLPLENLEYVRRARSTGAKIVLSTIRHPYEGVKAMYSYGSDTFYRKTKALGLSVENAITLREKVKLAARRNYRPVMRSGSFLTLQRDLLASVDAYFPMTESEHKAIEAEFSPRSRGFLVRNGSSFKSPIRAADSGSPKRDLVAIGRIEPRKNSVELARAALEGGFSIAFAGALNERHSKYASEFERLAARYSKQIDYLGRVEHSDLPQVFGSARAYINPAWFEVESQADIEAAALGLPLITTKHSYIFDTLGEDTPRLDPCDLVLQPAEAIDEAMSRVGVRRRPAQRSWDACAVDLQQAYWQVLDR
ncbi:glycosyltransferase [Agromyces sp. C10]|uniref:glycosyltransferase n=1 Tax=Agromyces sp. C10 TaxID=2935077 RepID=UPI00200A5E8C|nr:glycosyltransferase [Agromyces sp. C10]MCK8608287.1 glycosyltransferase [Agromyces sp. C10]